MRTVGYDAMFGEQSAALQPMRDWLDQGSPQPRVTHRASTGERVSAEAHSQQYNSGIMFDVAGAHQSHYEGSGNQTPRVKLEDDTAQSPYNAANDHGLFSFGEPTQPCGRDPNHNSGHSSGSDHMQSRTSPLGSELSPLSAAATQTHQEPGYMDFDQETNYTTNPEADLVSFAAAATSDLGGKEPVAANTHRELGSMDITQEAIHVERPALSTAGAVGALGGHEVDTGTITAANTLTSIAGTSPEDATSDGAAREASQPTDNEGTPDPQPALLANHIIDAVAKALRKQFKGGDVAVIVDRTDLSKTLLIASEQLDRSSTVLATANVTQAGQRVGNISCILVLDMTDPIPALQPLDINATPADLEKQEATVDTPKVTEKMTRSKSRAKTKIKSEDDDNSDSSTEDVKPIDRTTRWSRAYGALFSVICASSSGARRRVFDSDASKAVDHIQDVCAIATRYGALDKLKDVTTECLLSWVSNFTLYPAITEKPVSWLDISATLEKDYAFKEAFTHVCGLYESAGGKNANIRPDVLPSIQKKVKAIKDERAIIDNKLRNFVIVVPGNRTRAYVSWDMKPLWWLVNTIFTDWMKMHLDHLIQHDDAYTGRGVAQVEMANIERSSICEHGLREGEMFKPCLSTGGFYRLLAKADNSYLPLAHVTMILRTIFNGQVDEKEVGKALRELKTKAKEFVAPLAFSHLAYAKVEELEYLTCMEPALEDYPWDVREVDEDGDETMEN